MKINKILILALLSFVVFWGCDDEDYSGYSTLKPTNPTISVNVGTITPVSDAVKTSHTITLTMSEPQVVDVRVHVMVIDGTATEGDDFTLSANELTISAGRTTSALVVTILGDEIAESTETFKIQIGDERTANATISPVTAEFTINNATANDLAIGLNWNAEVYDLDGEAIAPTDLADMILTVTDVNLNALYEFDGSTFESGVLPSDELPNGKYYITASFYAVMDLGDQGGVDLDLELTFDQVGILSSSLSFPAKMNTSTHIASIAVLATITKVGDTWTITEFDQFKAADINFVGVGVGADGDGGDYIYDSEIVITKDGNDYRIDGLNYGWMQDFWGETITSSTPVKIAFEDDGTVEITEQAYIVTEYDGAPYPYTMYSIRGTWDQKMLPPSVTIDYEMNQEGFLVAAYCKSKGYCPNPYFTSSFLLTSGTRSHVKHTALTPKVDKSSIK